MFVNKFLKQRLDVSKTRKFFPGEEKLLCFRLRSPPAEEPCPLSLQKVFSTPSVISANLFFIRA